MMKKVIGMGLVMFLLGMLGLTDPNLVSASANALSYTFDNAIINEYEDVETRHIHINEGSLDDNITIGVSRTKSLTGSITVSAEIDAVVATTGLENEVGSGESVTVETTVTYTCAANKKTFCEYGSARVEAEGDILTWNNGEIFTGKRGTIDYSYASFSRKTEYPLD